MGSFGKKEVTRREGFEGVPLVGLSRLYLMGVLNTLEESLRMYHDEDLLWQGLIGKLSLKVIVPPSHGLQAS